jgi:opacity protein-like surface antigen
MTYRPGMRSLLIIAVLATTATATATAAPAVPPVKPTPAMTEAMAKVAYMRGVWIGKASGSRPDGTKYTVTQTERMGPMLGGDIVVIEGRGYNADGSTGFNAFGVVSYDPRTKKYELRSYAQGYAGTFELRLTADGYVWEVPAGPGGVMRFTATIKGDQWREVGEYVAAGKAGVPAFEMNLTRVKATDWPLGIPVTPSDTLPK